MAVPSPCTCKGKLLPLISQEMPFHHTYLAEVCLGLVEGDALDSGQWEAVVSESLCKRGGQSCPGVL